MTPTSEGAAEECRRVLRALVALAALLGLGLWGLAAVSRRRGLRHDVPVLLVGDAYRLWTLP